jgi:hypothetical protein
MAAVLLLAALVMTLPSGCASRVMRIEQTDYVNTAMHMNRPPGARTGEPLEINIVCVYPKDLKKEVNDRLAPGSAITSDVWYQDRPQPGDTEEMDDRGGRFYLQKSQIFLMTYDKNGYGKRIGNPLRGAVTDHRRIIETKFDFSGGLHDRGSIIYVFGKFIGPDGHVLPVPPAKFHPPGAYTEDLFVKVGVDESRAHYGQYIENVTPRKLHGSDDDRRD